VTVTEANTESIGRKAGRGLTWSLLGNVVTKFGSFGMGLVLARLLAPADFGVYAVALAALQFVMHVNDVGLIAATVQWRGRLEDMAPTAATIAASCSVLIYGGFWLTAPSLAHFAGVPQATPIIRLLTVIILVDGITAVRSGALMRNFRQDKLIRANMVGLLVNAAVAISAAASGAGAISFALGQVAGAIVTGIGVWIAAGLPARMDFDPAIARKLMVFGIPLAASLGVEAILMNADYVIIGHYLTPELLGFYLLAFNISTWALSIISSAVRYVSVAGFSRLSEVDKKTLSDGVGRTLPLLFTGLVPICVLTAALATPLIIFLYGTDWQAAAPVLRFLMILTVVRVLVSFALDVLMGAGATRSTLWVNLGWAVALVPALYYGTTHDQIRGAAIAHAVVGMLVAVPVTVIALHRVGVRLVPILPALVRPLFAGMVAVLVTLGVERLVGPHAWQSLAASGAAGFTVYLLFAVSPQQLRQWRSAIRKPQTPEVAHVVD
jgi:O-antigen/teichoic acid export membrane protein